MNEKDGKNAARYEERRTDFSFRSDRGGTVPLSCKPHLHYHIEFFYLLDGSVTVWVDSVEHTVEAGDLMIAFPNQIHRFRRASDTPEKYLLFIISPDMIPEFTAIFNSTLPHSPVVRNARAIPHLTELMDGLAAISDAPESEKYLPEVQKGYMTAFFGLLLPHITLDEIKLGDSRAVREVVNYCSQNYTADLSLEVLERELHINKYYISHLFSSKLGIRFNDYVNALRVSGACRLLRDTELPVTEISDMVGFNTQRTFNRAFTRFRGCSPGEFRRSLTDRVENASFPPMGVTPARFTGAEKKRTNNGGSMTELLGKIFIKNSESTHDPAVRRGWGTLVSIIGVAMNVLLFVGKFAVGSIFGAVSISADAINNLSDAGSQLISLVSFRISAKPADRKHPFGHARIEYVASMAVSFVILVIGFDLLRESAGKIFSHGETEFSWLSVAVLAASIAVKLWLALINRNVGKKIDSSVMRATAADSLSDVAATGGVLAAQLILRFTGINADAYLGVAVSLLIMWAGVKILNEQKNLLLGEAPDAELVKNITDIVNSYTGVLGVHDLIVHNYGPGRSIASLHVEVDGSADIFESHEMIDNIEKRLCDELGISATIHLDPIVTDDSEVGAARRAVQEKMEEIDPRFSIHDFRMVKGRTHTNLIFDIAAPFEQKMTDAEIRAAANLKLCELDPTFCGVITIDRI